MSAWLIPIVVALIGASGVIIAALIQRSKKKNGTTKHQEQNTDVIQNLTVNVNIRDEDKPVEQSSIVMENNTIKSVGQRRRRNQFLPNEEEIRKADIKDPQYFEKIATYLAENRSLDEVRITRNKNT